MENTHFCQIFLFSVPNFVNFLFDVAAPFACYLLQRERGSVPALFSAQKSVIKVSRGVAGEAAGIHWNKFHPKKLFNGILGCFF